MSDDDPSADPGDEPFDDDTYGEFLKAQRRTFEHQVPDPLLEDWVDIFNAVPGSSMGVTVIAHGFVVTGQLHAAAEYLHLLATKIQSDLAGDGQKEVGDVLAGPFRTAASEMQTALEIGPRPEDLPRYLHLSDTVIYQGTIATQLGLTRWRLASIDGWTLGTLRWPDS